MRYSDRNWFGRVNMKFPTRTLFCTAKKLTPDTTGGCETQCHKGLNVSLILYRREHYWCSLILWVLLRGSQGCNLQLFPMVAREGGCSPVWLSATSSLPVLSKALAQFSSSVQVPGVMLLVSWCLAQCLSSVRIGCNVFAEWRQKLRLSHRMQCSFEFLFTNRALFHFIK